MTLFKQMERLFSTKQEEEEPLIEHMKRFKQAQDDVKSIVGTEWLDEFVKSTEECINKTDTDTKEELKKNEF